MIPQCDHPGAGESPLLKEIVSSSRGVYIKPE